MKAAYEYEMVAAQHRADRKMFARGTAGWKHQGELIKRSEQCAQMLRDGKDASTVYEHFLWNEEL